MPLTRIVTLGERTVTVRELTVAEVRAWLLEHEIGKPVDAIQALAVDACSLDDIAHLCDLSAADMEAYAPSDLAPLITACQELNPHFFKVRAALNGVARTMLAEAQALASSAPPASSSSADTPPSGTIPGGSI